MVGPQLTVVGDTAIAVSAVGDGWACDALGIRQQGTQGELETIPRRAWLVLALTAMGQSLSTYAGSALNVAFPAVQESFEVSRSTLGWVLSGYSIAAAAMLLVAGRLADRISPRLVFLAGLSLFALTSFAAALAPGVGWLIAARTGQGLATAMMVPSSLALALPEFPQSRMSMAVAVWGGLAAISGASAAPISAAVVDLASWRWVFGALGPLALGLSLFGRNFLTERPRVEKSGDDGPLDLLGAPMGALAVGLVVAVILKGSVWGWTSALVLGALATGVALAYGVVVRSRSHPAPVLDLSLFSIRRFAVSGSLVAVYNMATTGYWFAAPVFLQEIWGWSILESGLAIAPGPLAHLLFARAGGKWADDGHHKTLLMVGVGLTGIGMALLAWRLTESGNYWTDLFPATVLVGISGALAWATFTSASLVDVDEGRYGQANGVALTVRQMGAALGVAMVIALIGDSTIATANDFRWAFGALTIACATCVVALAALFPSRNTIG